MLLLVLDLKSWALYFRGIKKFRKICSTEICPEIEKKLKIAAQVQWFPTFDVSSPTSVAFWNFGPTNSNFEYYK